MAIKKRKSKKLSKQGEAISPTDYHEYRYRFFTQNSISDTETAYVRGVSFQPKTHRFFHDVWPCYRNAVAKKLAIKLLKFDDVRNIEVSGKWVTVMEHVVPSGGTTHISGQKFNGRTIVTG